MDDDATERGMSAMDMLTDQWAAETDLLAFVARVASRLDRAQAIEDVCRQCFAEGALRGFYAGQDLERSKVR